MAEYLNKGPRCDSFPLATHPSPPRRRMERDGKLKKLVKKTRKQSSACSLM